MIIDAILKNDTIYVKLDDVINYFKSYETNPSEDVVALSLNDLINTWVDLKNKLEKTRSKNERK